MDDKQLKEYEKLKAQKTKQLKRQNKYMQEKYDRIALLLPKGEKEKILNIAINRGYKNITDYIRELIKKDSVILPEKQENPKEKKQAAFDPDFPDGLPFD